MRAGAIRHRLNLLRQSSTKGEYGADVISWTTDKTIWAAIWPIRGAEYFHAQQTQSEVTHKIRIRYTTLSRTTQIGPKCRFETRTGRLFEIMSVLNADERGRQLDCMCKETS